MKSADSLAPVRVAGNKFAYGKFSLTEPDPFGQGRLSFHPIALIGRVTPGTTCTAYAGINSVTGSLSLLPQSHGGPYARFLLHN